MKCGALNTCCWKPVCVHFWKRLSNVVKPSISCTSSVIFLENVTVSATIVDMYGLARITVLDENPMLGKERPSRTGGTTVATTRMRASVTQNALPDYTIEPGRNQLLTIYGPIWVI
ncbi:hypothetical protein T265_11786 [Opisthorchis viverrini]|uniref:Uncharacterized protein n=1 Tax=Opisthorchis viverrini TaxID=6198 RepID=A0A074YXB3_OPIVI|nr:hypothetical protein T265_11786 [Opisthorchis viverrini]KER19441.1 hypothetical protein T265_11786 [Opisthorchis viverrini]